MSTHKHIDKICLGILLAVLVLTGIISHLQQAGVIVPAMAVPGYESRLFDASRVHTIDIVMDDWEGFLETCENEEYAPCAVVIDNEAYKNVGIRAKGNTSLSMVSSYGNDRYSFKLEFDCYEDGKNYYGLDKISLNNIIQDNTYMKDFLTYQMMDEFGADAPLCSYVYITVNGEDWGLYLAVEAVEESFLARNYGNDYGELYKPDSQSMGGGRGNGGGFRQEDMERFLNGNEEQKDDMQPEEGTEEAPQGRPDVGDQDGDSGHAFGQGFSQKGNGTNNTTQEMDGERPERPGAGRRPFGDEETDTMNELQDPPQGEPGDMPQGEPGDLPQGEPGDLPQGEPGDMPQGEAGDLPQDGPQGRPDMDGQEGFGGMRMGSDDVCLIYSDDDYDSYQNIFDNAKTDVTNADKDRLIASLKQLGQQENLEDVVDIDEVFRYFVVHNFVCNFDSYTGSMIHNYYLYEKDGKLSMIPWDYNLAFGGFAQGSSGDATDMVNYPIDSPVSGGTIESRPMLAWIFADEEYTDMYHQYFAEFIQSYFESGYFSEKIDSVKEMIAPYVEKDPTKFCTYEEFVEGIDTLKQFCLLRAESIEGQLDGTIPATSEGQRQDASALIDASGISISDMGTMNVGGEMGGKRPGRE